MTNPAEQLRRIPVRKIMAALETTAKRFLDPASEIRMEAVREAGRRSGFSEPVIAQALDWTFSEITVSRMRRLLVSELGSDDAADDPALPSPRQILQICGGSIFQPAVNGVVYSLLVKSPILLKCSAHESVVLPLFVRAIRDADGVIGSAVQAAYWRGVDLERTNEALNKSDAVIVYGEDDTLSAVRSRTLPDALFIGHGHKISAAGVGAEALRNAADARDAARKLALDVSMYDQSGCLSPQCVHVETGGGISPDAFAGMLAEELSDCAKLLPPGRAAADHAAAVRAFRNEFEFRESQKDGAVCFFGDRLSYTVVVDPDPAFRPSPLGRTVLIKPIDDLSRLPEVLTPLAGHLQAVGCAPVKRLSPIADHLHRLGASLFCDLGRMQRPPLGWQNAAIPCLRGLLRG